jgi:hypothetical protein
MIVFDTTTNLTNGTGSVGSHTIGGGLSDTIAIVMTMNENGTSNPSAVTYGGQSMIQAVSYASGRAVQIWYLINPPTGSQAIVITGGNGDTRSSCSTFSGVDQVVPIDFTNSKSSPADPVTFTETSVSDGVMMIMCGASGGNPDADTNGAVLIRDTGNNGRFNYNIKGAAGSVTTGMGQAAGAGNGDWCVAGFNQAFEGTPTVDNFTSTTTWECPIGVTEVDVQIYGGGGAGQNGTGGATNGGGGGAYSSKRMVVVPGNTYTVTVAAAVGIGSNSNGNDSWFDTSGTVLAKGGLGGGSTTGGQASAGIGAIKFSGGNGGGAGGSFSGSGGGGAGSLEDGGVGGTDNGNAGVGGSVGGGNGGAGVSGSTGNSGSTNGGAGAGGRDFSSGGAGARGEIILTYVAPILIKTRNKVAIADIKTINKVV